MEDTTEIEINSKLASRASDSIGQSSDERQVAAEKILMEDRQERLLRSFTAAYETCLPHNGDPLSKVFLAEQVENLSKTGGLNGDLLAGQTAHKPEVIKVEKTESGQFTQFRLTNSCRLPALKIAVEKDGVKIDGKTKEELVKQGDEVLLKFAASQIDYPIKTKYAGDSNATIEAPTLTADEKALAKQDISARLSGDESKLQDYAKKLLVDPTAAAKVMLALNWRDSGATHKLVNSPNGELALEIGGDIFGRLQINAKGESTFIPPTRSPSITQEQMLQHYSEASRLRLNIDLKFAEQTIKENAMFPSLYSRLKPASLASQATWIHNKEFDKLLRSRK